MAGKALTIVVFFLIFLSVSTEMASSSKKKRREPCKVLAFYLHDILYDGTNAKNATAAIVAAPAGNNLTTLASDFHFGNLVVFDDALTVNPWQNSTEVGRAQGIYVYDGKKYLTAMLAFSLVLNSTEWKGTINLLGADPIMEQTRDISVVGGTGDFFMHRGVATIRTDEFIGEVYFRLLVNVSFYECW